MLKWGIIFMVFLLPIFQQPIQLNWMELQRVKMRPVSLKHVDGVLPLPIFTEAIKKYNGKIAEIDGYVIPLDKTGKTLVISAYNMAECFFCGKAGPASVMTVLLKKPSKQYKIDQIATFRGRLLLNDSNPEELFYVLQDAIDITN